MWEAMDRNNGERNQIKVSEYQAADAELRNPYKQLTGPIRAIPLFNLNNTPTYILIFLRSIVSP